jgi:hypothetical protein
MIKGPRGPRALANSPRPPFLGVSFSHVAMVFARNPVRNRENYGFGSAGNAESKYPHELSGRKFSVSHATNSGFCGMAELAKSGYGRKALEGHRKGRGPGQLTGSCPERACTVGVPDRPNSLFYSAN